MLNSNISFMKIVSGTSMSSGIDSLRDQLGNSILIENQLIWKLNVNDSVETKSYDLDCVNGSLKVKTDNPINLTGIFPATITCHQPDALKTLINRCSCFVSCEPDFSKAGSNLIVTADKLSRAIYDIDFESNDTIEEKEFDDALLCESYIRAIDAANDITVGSDVHIKYGTKIASEYLIKGALSYALSTIAHNLSRNRLRAGDGMPDVDERADLYMKLSNIYEQQFMAGIKKVKHNKSYTKYISG